MKIANQKQYVLLIALLTALLTLIYVSIIIILNYFKLYKIVNVIYIFSVIYILFLVILFGLNKKNKKTHIKICKYYMFIIYGILYSVIIINIYDTRVLYLKDIFYIILCIMSQTMVVLSVISEKSPEESPQNNQVQIPNNQVQIPNTVEEA